MITLLSLDLGQTTGYAVFKEGEPVETGNIPLRGYRDILQGIVLDFLPTHSIAERPVIFRGPLGDSLQEVINWTNVVLYHQVKYIHPSDWKQTPFKKHAVPRGLTPHERDALRMGYWYLSKLEGQ